MLPVSLCTGVYGVCTGWYTGVTLCWRVYPGWLGSNISLMVGIPRMYKEGYISQVGIPRVYKGVYTSQVGIPGCIRVYTSGYTRVCERGTRLRRVMPLSLRCSPVCAESYASSLPPVSLLATVPAPIPFPFHCWVYSRLLVEQCFL